MWGSGIRIVSSIVLFLLTGLAAPVGAQLSQSDEPPMVPVGLDAYLMWDRLPYQRIGVRAYMRSTYDRQGNNRTADASHYLYQESDTFNVALDVKGPGVLYFKRTNHWHGSPWHYEVDGSDFVVRETATADPVNARKTLTHTTFIPEELFPNPLTWTWSTTKGADLMWVPLPFEQSFRIAYSRTFYGTGYYIYHLLAPGMENLSRPLASWNQTPPDPKVLDLLNQAGSDIAPKGDTVTTRTGRLDLEANQSRVLAELTDGPDTIRALEFSISRLRAYDFGKCRLRVTWDGRAEPSIDAPIGLFFGAGHLYNSNDREYLVKGFPSVIRYDQDRVTLSCYWPMPFFRQARIELIEERGKPVTGIEWQVRRVPFADPINHVGYFHATYTDHPNPKLGQDMTFLDTAKVEGSGLWSGHFVGMSWTFSRAGHLGTLEGDPRFFFDDSKTPQAWGTGTEEWGGGGDYWGGRNMTIPLAGHPVGASDKAARNELDLVNSAYRFLVADIFPFGRRAVINLEHGAVNDSKEHYSGVAYWYGIDAPTLVLTDELNVCDPADAKAHDYQSPTADEPYILASRYEWGPDRHGEKIHFPSEQDLVRTMTGVTEFEVRLDPANLGVLLRRKFDYGYPNQHARVWVRGDSDQPWQEAGHWYTAGSNTCVFSYPQRAGELGASEHRVVTSNRRWREEEFLVSPRLTAGRERLQVRLQFVPNAKELFPGHRFPIESAWSESRYWVYSYKMPHVMLSK